jgi:hypothetical protein
MDVEHIAIAKMLEDENFLLKGNAKKQPANKRTIIFGG